jgi:hypothetical protein
MFTDVSLTSEGEWLSRLRDLRPRPLPLGPTVVIAPHSDDETTGAEGMTAKLPISRVIWQLCALSVLTMSAA